MKVKLPKEEYLNKLKAEAAKVWQKELDRREKKRKVYGRSESVHNNRKPTLGRKRQTILCYDKKNPDAFYLKTIAHQ